VLKLGSDVFAAARS